MGTEYTVYCEARIGGRWHNIDFYQRPIGRDLMISPVIWGKSAIGAALNWYIIPTRIRKDDISQVTRAAESDKSDDWQWQYIPGSWFIDKDLDAPEFCGYFPRQEVLDYKAGLADLICTEDMLDTEAYLALPDDGKIAYQYFEYTEKWGARHVTQMIKHAVECRIRAANDWLWSIPKDERGDTDSIGWSDVRLIVYTS